MQDRTAAAIEDRLVTSTDRYLEDVIACVDALPVLLARYGNGGDYAETAEEVRRLESDCDEQARRIVSLVSNASVREIGLRNARIHLNSAHLVSLYQHLDEVANVAERIAEELVTIEPSFDAHCRTTFREMATDATRAMAALADAVRTFVDLLCSHDDSGSVAAIIETVREIESDCDARRNEIVTEAFADGSDADALLVREFAFLFDRLVDAMEDATDQLVLLSATAPWITTEPDEIEPDGDT